MMPRISPLTISNKKGSLTSNSGFTMVEVMIVVLLMGLIISTAISRFTTNENAFKNEVKNFKLLTKSIHNAAKLYNTTFRIVVEMGDEDGEGPHKYWVENSKKQGLIIDSSEILEKKGNDGEEEMVPKAFVKNTNYLREDMTLPDGVEFDSVEISGEESEITRGKAYIYFTPNGLVDESAIHIKASEGLEWTIAIHPLTGKADIFTTKVLLKDLRNQ